MLTRTGRRWRRPARILWLAAALGASGAACGGGETYNGLISCTQSENIEGFGLLEACEEAPADARSQFQQGCTAPTTTDGGVRPTVVNAPCSRLDTLGGCEITSGGFKESFWYYGSVADADAGATPADIQRLCSASGGTYSAP
ncbi:MAG TPA: hypothetical protein VLC06_19105 [Polyangia bacterium]|nr:hypothetical protein [Polyangia bacterium]